MLEPSWPRLAVVVGLVATLAVLDGATLATTAAARSAGSIHPGSAVTLADVTCQTGVALHQGAVVYLAIPASCAGTAAGQPQDGCAQAEAPIGSPAKIAGATHRGILAYDSFTRMQALGTTSPNRCEFNDLALIRVNRADRHRVSGALPGTRAPKTVGASGPKAGGTVTLGQSSATSEGTSASGWAYEVKAGSAPAASDLGEPLISGGKVMGMLTVLPSLLPYRPNAEVANLHRALILLRRAHGFHHVTLLRAGQRG